MKEYRGYHMVLTFEKNRELVRDWLNKNPEKPMKACSVSLGLSYLTARKHIKAILSEQENIE